MTVNAVVMRPASDMRGGAMDHYMIGTYVVRAGGAGDANEAPRGFIQVTQDLLDLPVSPHFRLGQFLCKQESAWPRYMALREPLILKLETVLQKVNAAGIRADGFTVMSGFRTPHYNAAIGNRTTSSRHLYGGAADIFIDEDGDGRMDDLDRDGRHDRRDAEMLYRLIDGLSREPAPAFVPGGLSAYAANAAHGPFVHVDARGVRARW